MSSPSDGAPPTRRNVLAGALALASAAVVGQQIWGLERQPKTRVMTLSASSYEADLVDLLRRGIQEFPDTVARAKGARVVLKPNLVEYDRQRPINTDPRLVGAAAEAFRKLGAREVVVAEGPGHRRDTELMVQDSGLGDVLSQIGAPFVDLNVDVHRDTRLSGFTGLSTLPFAGTVLSADLLVSMPKMKTHHWMGCTLSMKNLFGTVPGTRVGWPKNVLHFPGIHNSIMDIWLALKPGFAIVDGIVGMEGDGPIRGTPVDMGAVVLGEQLPAVDAVSARLMGIDPWKLPYLSPMVGWGGTIAESRIERIGDTVARKDFELLPIYAPLRLGAVGELLGF